MTVKEPLVLRRIKQDYQEAIRVIQEIHSGNITQEQLVDIVLKLAELHPAILVEVKDAALIERKIVDLLKIGQKLRAIKIYRDATGVGLKEAKDVVDEIEKGIKVLKIIVPAEKGGEHPENQE